MTNVVGLLLFLYSWLALATPLPQDNPVPGGIAVVPIEVKASGRPDVFFQNRPVMRLKKESSWYAVVGIPLSVKPGDHELEIADAAGNILAVRFAVNNKSYASQHITLKNKKMVDPGKKELERIWREKKIINKALNSWNENIAWETYFLKPANGTLRDNFGLRRFFNKKPRNPHSGIDISAPKDSPVIAPAAGTVIKTGHYYFNGKTIFLDHGQGLISMFVHLNKINVKDGQKVARGEAIGKIGMTGRTTGPHLHWGLSLNRAMINPLLFFKSGVDTR